MSILLRACRITAIILWSIAIAVVSIPCRFTGGWKGIRKINHFTHLWNKGIARIINLRVTVTGAVPVVPGGLIVSNHLSYIDIIIHGSVLPLRYSPKSDVAKWPLLGWYIGLSCPVWTDRDSRQASKKTLRDFAKTMKNGIYLIVYPEGTSTDGKSGILPFKSTSFEAAIVGNAPIIPAITRYNEVPGRPTVCWYGDMTLLPHAWQLLSFPSIEATMHFLEPIAPDGRPRKELASFVHDVMAREYSKGA